MIHIGKKCFACEYYDNKFHTITENMKEFKYVKNSLLVNVVKKKFKHLRAMERHKRTHTAENPFALFENFVTKKFSQSGQVKMYNNDSHW